MKYLMLAFVFYYQNLFFSFVSTLEFQTELFELLSIYILILIIGKSTYRKLFFILWQMVYFIHFAFYSYFGDFIKSYDIKLFFTHTSETFETFSTLIFYFHIPIIMTILILLYLLSNSFQKIKINIIFLIPLFLFFVLNTTIYDLSFKLFQEIPKLIQHKSINEIENRNISLKKYDTNQSIILILGESIRAKEYLEKEFSFFNNNSYSTIYSSATNTDVSIPMLINGAKDPRSIDLKNNLFTLAKENNFTTYFITSQNKKYLQYITPYFGKNIDSLNIIGSKDDNDLINVFQKINFSKKSFVVIQMQGAHSPYYFHDTTIQNDIKKDYYLCVTKTNKILKQLSLLSKDQLFVFTSDHGENLGENKKYGHNRFTKEVYRVPLVILNENSFDFTIESHLDLYYYLLKKIGYDFNFKKEEKITVFGTMINAEDGFRDFLRKDSL